MDFKNNKLKKDLLKFTIETLSILITTKNKLKELYTTIDDESDHKKKATQYHSK